MMTVIDSTSFPSYSAWSSQRVSRIIAVLALLSAAVPEAESADCCDAYSVVTDVSKIMGMEVETYRASASSVGNCSWGEQCIPCVDENGDTLPVNSCQANPSCTEGGLSGICIDCLLGNYCPAGTINKYGLAVTTLCPDGEHCTPELTGARLAGGRTIFTYEYDKQLCPAGNICPAGTHAVNDANSCQKNVVDFIRKSLPEDVPEDAPSGYHCAEGTSGFEMLEDEPSRRLQECKEGNYCPTADEQLLCTSGHYCKKRVANPQLCPSAMRSTCTDEGITEPEPVYSWLIAILVVLLVFIGALCVSDLLMSRHSAHQAKEFLCATAEANKRFTFLKQVLQGIDISSLGGAPKGFHICIIPTTIAFEGLTLEVGSHTLLDRVSGIFAHSRMVAVMGPSGCGKSSLLNALCGKASFGEQSGCITINEIQRPISDIKHVTGFVPQDDTVFGDLTVLENLTFTASLRLPRNYTKDREKLIVQGVLTALELGHIQNALVGTVEKRGISGGQKKRVNIGVEMVTDPYVLLLDEPTSGLGATDTLVVTTALNSLTRTKRSVVAVVHQPRFQVFMLFHDLLLLYPGGRTVYFGPTHLAIVHFESIGFSPARGVNPADFFLDVISGIVPKAGDESFHPSKLSLIWDQKVGPIDHQGSYGSRMIKFLSSISAARTSLGSPTPGAMQRLSSEHSSILSPVGQRHVTDRHSVLNWDPSRSEAMLQSNSREATTRQLSRLLTSNTSNPLLREVLQRLSTWFESADTSGDGTVQMEELEQVFLAMGIAETKQELEEKFKSMDVNGDRSVDKLEFLQAMMTQLQVMIKTNAPTKDPSLVLPGEAEDQRNDPDDDIEEDEIYELFPRRRRQDSLRRQIRVLPERPMKRIWHQLGVLLVRALRQKLRSFDKVLLSCLTLGVCGMLVGLLLGSDHQPFVPNDTKLPFTMTMVLTVVGTLSTVTSLEVFGRDKVMFLRENSGGVSVTAYFTSKALLDMVENIWQPFFLLAVCYILIVPRQRIEEMALSLMFCSYAASGLGILVSICVSRENMTSLALLLGLVVGIFMNGMIAVTFNDVKANSSYGWVWNLSFSRWTGELLLVAELEAAQEEQYQLLLIEMTIMDVCGYFPPLETQSSWRESHTTAEEQQAAWATYFEDYTRRAYTWLFAIGLLERLLAMMLLAALPSIKNAIFVFNVSLQQWVTGAAMGALSDISRPGQSLSRVRKSIFSILSHGTSKADLTSNSKKGSCDDEELVAVQTEEDRPKLQEQHPPEMSPRSCHQTLSSPDGEKGIAVQDVQLKDINIDVA